MFNRFRSEATISLFERSFTIFHNIAVQSWITKKNLSIQSFCHQRAQVGSIFRLVTILCGTLGSSALSHDWATATGCVRVFVCPRRPKAFGPKTQRKGSAKKSVSWPFLIRMYHQTARPEEIASNRQHPAQGKGSLVILRGGKNMHNTVWKVTCGAYHGRVVRKWKTCQIQLQHGTGKQRLGKRIQHMLDCPYRTASARWRTPGRSCNCSRRQRKRGIIAY